MSVSRLPGVYFETVLPPPPEVLPRMDIAAFVGFAASGPVNVPVAIEDAVRFQDVFGQDQELGWDVERGETAKAQLAPAVRAFFRNGGRRCWVVRIADEATAKANAFLVPGMLQADEDGGYDAAWLEARSEGSWSDDLELNATITAVALEGSTVSHSGSDYTVTLAPGASSPAGPGDMLQLVFRGSQASPPSISDAVLYLPVLDSVTQPVDRGPGVVPGVQAVLTGERGFWFRPATLEDFGVFAFSPPAVPDSSGTYWLNQPNAVHWLTRPENVALPIRSWGFSTAQDEFVVDAFRSDIAGIQAGSWLRLDLDSSLLPVGAKALLLLVASIRGSIEEPPAGATSPSRDEEETAVIVSAGAWWELDEKTAAVRYSAAPQITVVNLELWVRDALDTISRVGELGLAPPQPRYLGYLPTDRGLFQTSDRTGTPAGDELRNSVSSRRFSLAAADSLPGAQIYLPLGVPGFPLEDFYQPAGPQSGTALERDGLAPQGQSGGPQFSADLFLDPDLVDASVVTLLTEAFHKQYQLRRGASSLPLGEPLLKMHAVLPLEEVSLLAVPDAVNRGWVPSTQDLSLLAAPTLTAISGPDAAGEYTLSWSKVTGAISYTLQQSSDPQFATVDTELQSAGEQSDPFAEPAGCPSTLYFRVQANGLSGIGPWSNTMLAVLPRQAFAPCEPGTVEAPILETPVTNRGRTILVWSSATPGVDAFRLETAGEPAFEFPELLYTGVASTASVWRSPTQVSYFRVSAVSQGTVSPWSNTVVTTPDSGSFRWEMIPAGEGGVPSPAEDQLLLIHRAMLRVCAARSDMLALVTLPSGYRGDMALTYQQRLVGIMMPEEPERTLSFGAMYHPWLLVRDAADDTPDAVRSVTPDGTIAGSIVTRTLAIGAWVSPANQKLLGVVDLDPHLPESVDQSFFDSQVNLVVQQPRGFLSLSSFTLSTDVEVREVNVRRLLILLRRLALREGMEYVFSSNDSALSHLVQRRFEDLLGNMFLLGAFAGDTQDQGFRVVTDSSVNPPEMTDQGRFTVELRVAPSRPMEFLTVRLVQAGGEIILAEEF